LARRRGLDLHIQPRAPKTEVVGRHGDAIKIRVKAPPVEGAANDELIRFLAKRFKVARASVRLVSGAASRHKQVEVDDLTAEEVARSLLGEA
jgi:uncharacterized protein (TIGR00251 family)